MSANKEAVRLCEKIVRQAFGDVVTRVASTLLNRGRLNIITLKHLSALPLATTQAAVLTLIQHNLVRYCGTTGDDEVPVGGDQFEFETWECLMRLRWGRIVAATEEEFGEEAAKVVQYILMSGKLCLPDILARFTNTSVETDGSDSKTPARITSLIHDLLMTRHLAPTTPMLHEIFDDHLDRHFKSLRSRSHGLLSKQDDAKMRSQVFAEVMAMREAEMDVENAFKKQPIKAVKKDAKRRAVEQQRIIRPDAYLRVNYTAYDIRFRNELLIDAANQRLNKPAASVLKAILKATIAHQTSIGESVSLEAITTTEILKNLPSSDLKQLPYGLSTAAKAKDLALVEAYTQILAADDALGESSAPFLARDGDAGNAAYRVEFDRICTRLKAAVLSSLVQERVGRKAARILQILITGKKLSEQQVQEYAMMELKDCRAILSELAGLCLIETQDVPRTAARSRLGPGQAYHLWQVDVRKVYSFLITTMYKTLGNILQRQEEEIANRQAVLDKMQRSDVAGREMLLQREQTELEELDRALEKLRLAEMRTELNVMILRDLPGGPVGVRYARRP